MSAVDTITTLMMLYLIQIMPCNETLYLNTKLRDAEIGILQNRPNVVSVCGFMNYAMFVLRDLVSCVVA